jgi:dipeptidyl aminopeptidase/acylaminoacyl peptidase
MALVGSSLLVGCEPQVAQEAQPGQTAGTGEGTDLAAERGRFVTRLVRKGPAPQEYEEAEPPEGVRAVEYPSGELKLKGWLSDDPGDGERHPAVVFLHGGFAFSPVDWRDAAPFAEAGFVLFTPMLRGENGNPGFYETFYGEADDAIAAGRFVAALPYVDPDRVFIAGHSAGAILTVQAGMMPSPYQAGAALSGWLDMESWVASPSAEGRIAFDASDPEEVRLRDPLAFAGSLRIPMVLYSEPDMMAGNEPFADWARELGKDCELVQVPGDHQSMVAPAVELAIEQFRAYPGK